MMLAEYSVEIERWPEEKLGFWGEEGIFYRSREALMCLY